MASLDCTLPLKRSSVLEAHEVIRSYVHLTAVQTNTTLSSLASTPQSPSDLVGTPWEGQKPAEPKMQLFFKCENFQRIGAFKVRGAFHAVRRLINERGIGSLRASGVITHSSGNHAQALALAAKTFSIPAHIVMPFISTPSKIAGTEAQGAHIHFSGSTSREREEVTTRVIAETGAVFVPPYDHPDIILGQGTMAIEFERQVADLLSGQANTIEEKKGLSAVITPCGGGGMLSGNAIALQGTGIKVFGAEPDFEGADDAKRGVEGGERITEVSTLTIADGLRTPLGEWTWKVISDKSLVSGLYTVTEENIRNAMRLVLERMKCFVEPSAAVGLATVLYNEDFRKMVEAEAGDDGWNIGVILSGGNTTVQAIGNLYSSAGQGGRADGRVGADGATTAEGGAR
ncbi:Serine racemase [Stagonosporopsis vannaccii]|nr:Serine racemase [Stagonosporopsis vannaccii]